MATLTKSIKERTERCARCKRPTRQTRSTKDDRPLGSATAESWHCCECGSTIVKVAVAAIAKVRIN